MRIEIVTHCFANRHSQYAVLLRAQLSSLVLYPPQMDVCITVCHNSEDRKTVEVLQDFEGPSVRRLCLDYPRLWRRAIGRNKAALETYADLVWFADCDYVFGPGCLDALEGEWNRAGGPDLVWPCEAEQHRERHLGDVYVKQHENANGRIAINPVDFQSKPFSRAIGGIQIVTGVFARRHGYLRDHERYQTPIEGPMQTRDDVVFREYCAKHGTMREVKIPNLYRIRHSISGLDG